MGIKKNIIRLFRVFILGIAPYKIPLGAFEISLSILKNNGLKCTSVLDIGANKGEWSSMAAKILDDCPFTLIEPQIELEDDLKKLIRKNAKWEYLMIGIGAIDMIGTLTKWPDTLGSSFLPPETDKKIESGMQKKIAIRSIDSLLQEELIEMPSLIKIDVQGFEIEVLKGASSTFGHTEIYIIETSLFSFEDVPGQPEFYNVVKYMFDRGYVVYDFAGFLRRPLDNALGQADIVFVKSSSLLRGSNNWS